MPNQNNTNNNSSFGTADSAPVQSFDDIAPPPPPITNTTPTVNNDTNPPVDSSQIVTPRSQAQTNTSVSGVGFVGGDQTQQPPPPQPEIPPVVTTSGKGSFGGIGKKRIATILGLLLLVGGASVGVFLVQQNQEIREKAEETCLTGCTDSSGNCQTGTTNSYCGTDGEICQTCSLGTTCTNGACVTSQQEPEIQCLSVKAYIVDEEKIDEVTGKPKYLTDATMWEEATQNKLSELEAGDIVFFTVTGKASDPSKFTQVKFKVNNEATELFTTDPENPESDPLPTKPSSPVDEIEVYYRYPIPEGVTEFTVRASMYHEEYENGWIDPIGE